MKSFILDSIQLADYVCWLVVVIIFTTSAVFFDGDLRSSLMGAAGIVVLMFFIGTSIEIVIETLKNVRGIGTLVGFITNGPEALCLIVGLVYGDMIFAASTPLGSNVMNPTLLIIAAFIAGKWTATWGIRKGYLASSVVVTAAAATVFFKFPESLYWLWVLIALSVSVVVFITRPHEDEREEEEHYFSKWYLVPALLVLVAAGYFLDPTVSAASEASHLPKGVIGFFVLSLLTSWPEFKSSLGLLRRGMVLEAILNIVVSNVTNIWLAVTGVGVYMLFG